MREASAAVDSALSHAAEALSLKLMQLGWQLVTAESCTGGWVAKTCTDLPGSSGWFDRGVVSYSNQAKSDLLGVKRSVLAKYGAVSRETAEAMVRGIVSLPAVQVGIATTGIAGPSGGSEEKPVGLVCFAWLLPQTPVVSEAVEFAGDREAVRRQSVHYALSRLNEQLDGVPTVANH